jgi:hypothetical protein
MKAIHVASPSGQKDFFCDEVGARAIVEAYRRDRGVQDLCQEPLEDGIRFDGGGAMRMGEEDVGFEINGIRFHTTVTQFAFALEAAKKAQIQEKYSGCVVFGGWMGFYYILSVQTRDALVTEMERLWPSVEHKALAEEDALLKALHENSNVANLRRKIADIAGDHGTAER